MSSKLPNGNSKLIEYEPFNNIDYVVTDLDGTLIQGNAPVRKQVKKKILGLHRKRIKFTVATGRTYFGAKELLTDIGVKKYIPVALYNGSVVLEYGTNHILYEDEMEEAVVKMLWKFGVQCGITMYFYSFNHRKNGLDDSTDIEERVYAIGESLKKKDVNDMSIQWVRNESELPLKVVSVLIDKKTVDCDKERSIYDVVKINSSIAWTDSGNGFIEIKSGKSDKSIIFDILRKRQQTETRILAIGDNDNDIELFKAADISVAVVNVSENAVKYIDYICDHESAEGFLDMLDVLERAKKYLD